MATTIHVYIMVAIYRMVSCETVLKTETCPSRLSSHDASLSEFQVELYHQQLFANSRGIILSLPDSALSATRSYNANHGPQYVKLGAAKADGCSHAWCTGKPLYNDHLTIDMGTSHVVTGVEIAGRGDVDQMVTKFSVQTSADGIHWVDQGTYQGPHSHLVAVKRKLKRAVIATFVRIFPLDFKNHPSMRLDVLVHDLK